MKTEMHTQFCQKMLPYKEGQAENSYLEIYHKYFELKEQKIAHYICVYVCLWT